MPLLYVLRFLLLSRTVFIKILMEKIQFPIIYSEKRGYPRRLCTNIRKRSGLYRLCCYWKNSSVKRLQRAQLGHHLVRFCTDQIHALFPSQRIKISAQAHLENFYNQHGFEKTGDTYLEDGIPHIAMIKQ